ncbi:MAG: Sapep family Mn(2+)-dependent dipeptidase [Fimbriimonadales bacterium]|nr:Sapep family Mn(2+)-dependent dipeptidase [Fimbriimonadales bacterium]
MNREALIQWIESHTDEMIRDFQALLRAPSVRNDEERAPGMPFGKGVREALDVTLEIGRRFDLNPRDFEGYACDMTLGDGAEMVASLSHIDVVPAGNDWKYPPFGAEIEGGYIYARGATDNKGATLASIYALRALKELQVPLQRRVRLIIGCDEESRWECMQHYMAHEPERPVWGVSPDAGWPFIYGEKGIANLYLEKEVDTGDGVRVLWARGGERHNMVPDRAEALINTPLQPTTSVEGVEWHPDPAGWRAVAKGKSAHGSHPEAGVNAVAKLLEAIEPLNLPDNEQWLHAVLSWANALDGAALGIAHTDEPSGALTSNLGVFDYDGKHVCCVFNIRYPVTWSMDALKEHLQPALSATGFRLGEERTRHTPPLFIPPDTPFLQAILKVYREETGDYATQPTTMGGGTYARTMPNLVAIGAAFEGDGEAHQANERISIESMKKLVRCYARIFEQLANLA